MQKCRSQIGQVDQVGHVDHVLVDGRAGNGGYDRHVSWTQVKGVSQLSSCLFQLTLSNPFRAS